MSSRGRDPANPYAAPEAPLAFAADAVPSGGTLEQTLAGGTRLTIEGIISDAWKLIPGFKGTFWLAALGIFGASIVLGIVTAVMAQTTNLPLAANLVNLALTALVFWPLQVGVLMLGVRRAAGVETRASMIGEFFPHTGRIAGLLILQSVLVLLGTVLFVIPGIYLGVSYIISVPLLIDRRMGIWEALETSRRAVTTCWFRTFGLLLTIGLINLLGMLMLGIGLIWMMPLGLVSLGMLYHRLAGYAGGETN